LALIDGLISYWKADTDGSFLDAHASNDGTITGATFQASGKINGCYQIATTGTVSNKISIPDTADFDITTTSDFTYNLWIYLDNVAAARAVIAKASSGTTPSFRFFCRTDEDFDLYFHDGTNVASTAASKPITTGQWVMTTITINRTSDIASVYYDTVFQYSLDISTIGDMSNAEPLLFGNVSYTNDSLTGELDEIGIWNRVLSGAELSSLYNSSSGFAYPFSSSPTNVGDLAKWCDVEDTSIANINGKTLGTGNDLKKFNDIDLTTV